MRRALRASGILITRLALLAAAPALSAVFTAPACAQVQANPTETSIDLLRQAVTPQADGGHLPLLFALRQLRDPDLKPLFHQLIQTGEWQMQVHAALGLAEIDPSHQIDPFVIKQVAPQAQEAVVTTALDLQLLPPELIPRVLELDQLQPMARLFLYAEQQSLKQPLDTADLGRFVASEDIFVAGIASALLAQGGDDAAFATWKTRLATLPQRDRDSATLWMLDVARRYQLTTLVPWITSVLAQEDLDRELGYRATFALIMLDSEAGLKAWRAYLGDEPSFPQRVRCGTLLLACEKHAPAAAYDIVLGTAPLADDEQLLARIVDVGRAVCSNSDPSATLIALLDLGHLKTSLWAIEYLKQLPPEQSRPVYEHLIDRMLRPREEWTDGTAQAVQATSRLFEIDHKAVLDRLKTVPDDSPLQQAILLGLFETTSPEVGAAAAALPRIGSGQADSLALLLIAKHTITLNDLQKKQLGVIAAGGGGVSNILQVQAAWLYLKRTNQLDRAMAAVATRTP